MLSTLISFYILGFLRSWKFYKCFHNFTFLISQFVNNNFFQFNLQVLVLKRAKDQSEALSY